MSVKWKTATLVVAIVGACALSIALVSGVFYERVQRARDGERYPRIGRLVDIGGRTLNIYCSGTGQPAIILQSGATWPIYASPKDMFEYGAPRPGYSWVRIQRELAQLTTTCWYDRPGSGWSDLGPYPRDAASQARDLHAALRGAAVPPPYVLVAESSAALDARVYASLYTMEVAGMVLVDGVHPEFFFGARRGGKRGRFPQWMGHTQDIAAQGFNLVGLYRAGQTLPLPDAPEGIADSEWRTIWHLTQSSKGRSALLQDIAAWQRIASQAAASGSFGDRPLVVVSSENTAVADRDRDLWRELQREMVRLSTRGTQVTAGESNGDLIYQAPTQIVDAVRQVLADEKRSHS